MFTYREKPIILAQLYNIVYKRVIIYIAFMIFNLEFYLR